MTKCAPRRRYSRHLGYRVLKARDAASALSVIESGAPIDLLFTDVVMPGPLKSTELARKAKERLPDLAVLFTSGYTENSIVHGGRLDPGVELLSKPYSREALARRIRHRSAIAPRKSTRAGGWKRSRLLRSMRACAASTLDSIAHTEEQDGIEGLRSAHPRRRRRAFQSARPCGHAHRRRA